MRKDDVAAVQFMLSTVSSFSWSLSSRLIGSAGHRRVRHLRRLRLVPLSWSMTIVTVAGFRLLSTVLLSCELAETPYAILSVLIRY
jgi:hypothetical protein